MRSISRRVGRATVRALSRSADLARRVRGQQHLRRRVVATTRPPRGGRPRRCERETVSPGIAATIAAHLMIGVAISDVPSLRVTSSASVLGEVHANAARTNHPLYGTDSQY